MKQAKDLSREEIEHLKAKRRAFLVRIAGENRERFAVEWERQISFWLHEIHQEISKGSMTGRPVFDIVREAKALLAACGESVVKEHGNRTVEILNNECCRMIAPMMGSGVYRMNAYLG